MSKDIPDYMRGFDLNDDWGIAGTAAEAPKSPTIDTLIGGSVPAFPNSPISRTVRFSPSSSAGRNVTHIGL